MAESREANVIFSKPVRAPRGPALSCQGWHQEAALRLLMNSADPSVADEGEQLIPAGGIGKLARDGQAFQAILDSLRKIEDSQTLLVRDGAPVTVLQTRRDAPRVLVVNAALPRFAADWMFTGPASALPEAWVTFRAAARRHFGGTLAGRLVVSAGMGGMGGAQALAVTLHRGAFLGIDPDVSRIKRRVKAGFCEIVVNHLDEALRILKNAVRRREPASVALIGNSAEVLPELAQRGVLPDLLTDQTPADDPSGAYIPCGLAPAQAAEWRDKDPSAAREKSLDSIAIQVRAMLELKKLGAVVFEFGNGLFAAASARGVADARDIPDFASEYLLPDASQGRGLLTVVALSGDSADLARVDALCLDLFPEGDAREWMEVARKHPSPGLPARNLWMTGAEAAKLGAAVNDLVGRGQLAAPVAIGRSIRRPTPANSSSKPHTTQNASSGPAATTPTDSAAVSALLDAASGASWAGVQAAATGIEVSRQTLCLAVVADGQPESAERIARAFASPFATNLIGAPSLFAT